MRGAVLGLALLGGGAGVSGCYSGSRAAADVNVAWRGHARVELASRLGDPTSFQSQPDGTRVFLWRRTGTNIVSLPGGHLNVDARPGSFTLDAEAHPGVVERVDYDLAAAVIGTDDRVLRLDSDFVVAGIPAGENVHTGVIFGLHAGMGGRADAVTPIPSGGLYIGGMIGPRHALVGTYSFVNGKDDMGYAMGHAATFGVQYWPAERLSLMGGASMVLGIKPGLVDASLSPGASGALSYAFLRSGSFVLDGRFDLTVATEATFGMVGVGVNVN